MEVICINDVYDPGYTQFYKEHGVTVPQKDKIYTVREIRKNSVDGRTGILLEEIHNPQIPYKHPVMGGVLMVEPSFNLTRFTTLLGEPVRKEQFELENA